MIRTGGTEEVETIQNEFLRVEIDPLGAEPVHIIHNGRERLWQNETGAWSGHAPVLFPVCGNCVMTVRGKDYPLAKHGFARRSLFACVEKRENAAAFRLLSNAETRACYPFAFSFTVRYELRGNLLEIAYTVENRGKNRMPFSCGGHLSHALREGVGAHFLRFSEEEKFLALVHDEEGRLNGLTSDMGMGKELKLQENLFKNGNTVIFGGLRSGSVTLFSERRGALAEVGFTGFENLLLWKPENANMLCIEPWANLPDRAGERMEFAEKAGVLTLAPHTARTLIQTITYY